MNRLYVRFAGDNDFCNTVQAFVKAIAPRILLGEYNWNNITKEQVAELFNNTAYALYMLHQKNETNATEEDYVSYRSYLKIKPKDVYFDNEIDLHTNFNNDGCLAVIEHDNIGYYIM